jgi:signal transduction histidine kinase/CheY-like chemotaxis protein
VSSASVMGNSNEEQRRKLLKTNEGYNLRKQLAICIAVMFFSLISFLPYMLGLELYDEDPNTPYSGASTDPLIDIVNAVLVACMCMMLLEALLDAQSLYIPIKIAFPRFVMVLGVLFTSLVYYLRPHEENLDRLNFLICSHYARLYAICGGISFRLLNDSTERGRRQWLRYVCAIILFLTEMQLKQWTSYYKIDNSFFNVFATCITFGTILICVFFVVKVCQLSTARSSEFNLGHHYYDLISHAVLSIAVFGMNTINIYFGFQSWKHTSGVEIAGYNLVCLFATVLFFFTSSYISQRHFVKAKGQLINKKSFVRYVSHEIRTPLNTVYLGIQLLTTELKKLSSRSSHDDDYDSTNLLLESAVVKKLQDIVNDIGESCFVSIDILNDLLLIDKIEEGNLNLDMQPKNARDLFKPCIHNFDVQAMFSKVELSVDLNDISNVMIKADETKIVQVVRNIVSNALKFTPNGGHIHIKSYFIPDDSPNASPTVSVSGYSAMGRLDISSNKVYSIECANSRTSGKVRIEFMDTGPGMSEENKAKLFESVIQFDANVLQSGGGSGLGLFISNAIMKRHSGGCIGVMPGGVSVKGRGGEEGTVHLEASDTSSSGCVFYIEIDGSLNKSGVADVVEDNGNLHNIEGLVHHFKDDEGSLYRTCHDNMFSKVLVTEDSKFNRKMMNKALDKYATEIVMAEDGIEAVEAVRQCMARQEQPFDIIFMDSLMPNMNGIEATTIIIKELNFPNPVIAVTGNMLPEDVKAFENAGVLTVLGKPLDLDKLDEVIRGNIIYLFNCFISLTNILFLIRRNI